MERVLCNRCVFCWKDSRYEDVYKCRCDERAVLDPVKGNITYYNREDCKTKNKDLNCVDFVPVKDMGFWETVKWVLTQ